MKEVIYSCLRRALSRKIMETLKALILTNIMLLNLDSKGLILLYYHITDSSISYRTLGYSQPVVPFIDSSRCCVQIREINQRRS